MLERGKLSSAFSAGESEGVSASRVQNVDLLPSCYRWKSVKAGFIHSVELIAEQ